MNIVTVWTQVIVNINLLSDRVWPLFRTSIDVFKKQLVVSQRLLFEVKSNKLVYYLSFNREESVVVFLQLFSKTVK